MHSLIVKTSCSLLWDNIVRKQNNNLRQDINRCEQDDNSCEQNDSYDKIITGNNSIINKQGNFLKQDN